MWINQNSCTYHNASSFGMEFVANAQRVHLQTKQLKEIKEREEVPELLR